MKTTTILAVLVLALTAVAQPMQGTYTISPTGGGDFTSFAQAVEQLRSRGMSGAVACEATEGTYYEGLLDMRGIVSSSHTLTFRPKQGHRVTIDGQGAAAIFYADGNYAQTYNVKLEGLRLTNSSTGGWATYAVNRLNGWRISNCTFDTPTGPWFNGYYDSVIGCRVNLTGNNGIYLYSSANCYVANNFVTGARMSCLYTNTSSGNHYCDNTCITDSTAPNAIAIYENSSANTFIGNIVVSSWVCMYRNGGSQFPIASDYNCWHRHSGNQSLFYIINVGALSLVSWRSRSANRCDMHSMDADPQVESVPDPHLLPTSPCINAGTVISGITVDIDSEPRGTSPDIGADEFYPTDMEETSDLRLQASSLRIEPNPARGQVVIRIPPTAYHSELRLFDASGRAVLTHFIPSSHNHHSLSLDLRGLAAGIYLIRVTAGGAAAGAKLIVK